MWRPAAFCRDQLLLVGVLVGGGTVPTSGQRHDPGAFGADQGATSLTPVATASAN